MDLEKIKKRLEKRYDERYARLENRRLELLDRIITQLPDFLSKFPSVTKVVIFGSLIRPGYFTELSDVDIAIKDLPNPMYWQAFSWFENCLKFENIDLVRFEDAKPSIMKYIENGGVIYEQEIREFEGSKS
jgi:predicted nucleotidyltransferase